MRFVKTVLTLAAIALAPVTAHATPLKAVATISILADITHQVGGDLVNVTPIVGPDGDAHTYKPTPQDAKALAEADVIITNGLGLEGWLSRLIKASGTKAIIAVASTGVTPRQMVDDGRKITDPHAWQNVANARIYAHNIASALTKALPDQTTVIQQQAAAYDAQLADLDSWVNGQLADIPAAQRKIITSHDAFGYYGAAYNVTLQAPQGMSTEGEPTAAQVAKLITQMKSEKIHRVFFENMASPKVVQRIAEEANAKVGDAVYSDALSKADGPAATYTNMIRHNTTLFREAMLMNGK
ncbi:MAG: zinc ABC transporter substrate-binding protein [Alphaproteobacteria bacterium]|nr:zinc ABC transporter substrate-binding protein [Alphaproteobacteria bacterium]MBV8548570.1 zinc ABC transporter substrate-binding protein [Alphaproteobacteria bacterium]